MGSTQAEGPRANGPRRPQASSWPPSLVSCSSNSPSHLRSYPTVCQAPPNQQEHWRETETSQKEDPLLGRGRTWKASQRRWLFNCSGSHLAFL